MPSPVCERFVSESIIPLSLAPTAVTGEPCIPIRFRWRRTEYEIVRILDQWKTTGPCRNGSGEKYVRRHWYDIETADGSGMRIYFERNPRNAGSRKRWWLATARMADLAD